VFSDILNDLWDIQHVFAKVQSLATPRTRLILNSHSKLWELPLAVAARLGLALPTLPQNWLSTDDIVNLLSLAGLEPIRLWQEILWPLPTPVVAALANRFLVKLWPFRYLALTNFIMARLQPQRASAQSQPLVSVIVPARNEAGNIPSLVARVPEMGRGTELVFVEGHSDDGTYEIIEQEIRAHPERRCQLHRQAGFGKGDAVRLALEQAQGEIAIVLDADLSVSPEILPRFVELLRLGRGEFINGVRLVYPMEDQAMRFLNLLVNKLLCWVFSWLLGQPVKDALCGTKALWKADYDRIVATPVLPVESDPFGDFELLFGAARLGLKIVDCPVRYQARTYGSTKIERWRHGWMLLRMSILGARRLRFV